MPAAVPIYPQRAPRRARYLIPLATPGRREILAALALLAALAGLLFAQVTLGSAVAFYAIGKITRWRPVWLAVPAACGVVWVLAIGPAAALDGFLAAPRAVVALIDGVVADPARLIHLDTVSTGSVRWFPGQHGLHGLGVLFHDRLIFDRLRWGRSKRALGRVSSMRSQR